MSVNLGDGAPEPEGLSAEGGQPPTAKPWIAAAGSAKSRP